MKILQAADASKARFQVCAIEKSNGQSYSNFSYVSK